MARIRSIKPEFWTSEQIMALNPLTRLLFIGMWNFADDYGRMPYAPATIKAQILPNDTMELQMIRNMLTELSSAGLILIYSVKGREYLEITGWHHQKIDKPHKPKHPGPVSDEPETISEQAPAVAEPSPNIPRTLAVGEDRIGEEKKEDTCRDAYAPEYLESQFEEFWKVYPKRKGDNPKAPARKSFLKIAKQNLLAENLVAATRKFAASNTDKAGTEFIPMAVTWLTQARWEQYLPDPAEEARRRELYARMEAKGWRWIDGKWVKPEEAA